MAVDNCEGATPVMADHVDKWMRVCSYMNPWQKLFLMVLSNMQQYRQNLICQGRSRRYVPPTLNLTFYSKSFLNRMELHKGH